MLLTHSVDWEIVVADRSLIAKADPCDMNRKGRALHSKNKEVEEDSK